MDYEVRISIVDPRKVRRIVKAHVRSLTNRPATRKHGRQTRTATR